MAVAAAPADARLFRPIFFVDRRGVGKRASVAPFFQREEREHLPQAVFHRLVIVAPVGIACQMPLRAHGFLAGIVAQRHAHNRPRTLDQKPWVEPFLHIAGQIVHLAVATLCQPCPQLCGTLPAHRRGTRNAAAVEAHGGGSGFYLFGGKHVKRINRKSPAAARLFYYC